MKKWFFLCMSVVLCLTFFSCDVGEEPAQTTESEVSKPMVDPTELLEKRDDGYRVFSPDKSLIADIYQSDKGLVWTLTDHDGTVWARESAFGLIVDGEEYFTSDALLSATPDVVSRQYEMMGNQKVMTDDSTKVVFSLQHGTYTYSLEVRLFSDGFAYRYLLPDTGSGEERIVQKELSTFVLRDDVQKCWYGVNSNCYESIIKAYPAHRVSDDKINAPITAAVDGGGYISLMEADANDSYAATFMLSQGDATFGITNSWETDNEDHPVVGNIVSVWRLVNVASTLNELVNNYNIFHVAADPDAELYGDSSWIVPGRCAWAWGSTYDTATYEDAQDFTATAAKLGYEYNLNDYNWRNSWGSNEEIKALCDYGKTMGVEQLLIWEAEWVRSSNAIRTMINRFSDCGVAGVKLDLWDRVGNEVKLDVIERQRYLLEYAAQNEMIVLLHGVGKGLGWNRTYPNEISREGIYGAEWLGSSTGMVYDMYKEMYAGYLTSELFTRFLSGPADFTPTCTSAMEIASMVCVNSPLLVNMSPIDQILDNEAVEMIKSLPTVWDRTVVVSNSEIGKFAVFAKENNKVWYLGAITSEQQRDVKVALNEFLNEGTYLMEMWYDLPDGTMACRTETVTKETVLTVDSLLAGQGFVCRFTKLALSQYGGAISDAPILVTTAGDCVVRYTVDGSDPMTSKTAKEYKNGIALTDTCRLRVAIVSGDGEGTELSYRFNRIIERISLSQDDAVIVGAHDCYRFEEEESTVAIRISVEDNTLLEAVNLYGHKAGGNTALLAIRVYEWNTDYATTIAGNPVINTTLSYSKNDVLYAIPLIDENGNGISAGEYLLEVAGATDSDGTYYDNSGVYFRERRDEKHVGQLYVNGKEEERGLEGSIDVIVLPQYEWNVPTKTTNVNLFKAFPGTTTGEKHKSHNMANSGNAAATHFAVESGELLKKIVITVPSWFDDKGTITYKVFRWKGNYDTTIAGEPLYAKTFDGYRDNSVLTLFMENKTREGLGEGEYLLYVCDMHDSPTSGIGIYFGDRCNDSHFKDFYLNDKKNTQYCLECSLTLVSAT